MFFYKTKLIISSIILILTIIYYQVYEYFFFPKKLNYEKQVSKTIDQINNINGILNRKTADIGTIFRDNIKVNKGFSMDNLNGIININEKEKWVEVGGKTRFYDVLNYTLKYNLMPKIVPEFNSITVGGAISGVSIESSSFKYGWVHDTIIDMDILLSSGELLYCTRDNENKDLFNAIPNSYGTIGYVTKAKLELVESKSYVKVVNTKFSSSDDLFKKMKEEVNKKDADFIEAVAYKKNELYLSLGYLTNEKEKFLPLSKYPSDGIYFKSIRNKRYNFLTLYDYYWRWDSDMFWGADDVEILKSRWLRKFVGRFVLNTRFLRCCQKVIKNFSNKNSKKEIIIQDLGIPHENADKFYNWICETINDYPIWICPVVPKKSDTYFWKYNDSSLYYDIGLFGFIKENKEKYYYNKLIESKLIELGGNKCFYSDTFFSKNEFDNFIDPKKYEEIKLKYDTSKKLQQLYDKVVNKIC